MLLSLWLESFWQPVKGTDLILVPALLLSAIWIIFPRNQDQHRLYVTLDQLQDPLFDIVQQTCPEQFTFAIVAINGDQIIYIHLLVAPMMTRRHWLVSMRDVAVFTVNPKVTVVFS